MCITIINLFVSYGEVSRGRGCRMESETTHYRNWLCFRKCTYMEERHTHASLLSNNACHDQ